MLVQNNKVYVVHHQHKHGNDMSVHRTYGGAVDFVRSEIVDPYLDEFDGIHAYPYEDGECYIWAGEVLNIEDVPDNWPTITYLEEFIEILELQVRK